MNQSSWAEQLEELIPTVVPYPVAKRLLTKAYKTGRNEALREAAEKVKSIKVMDGSGTERFVLEIAAKSILKLIKE